MGGVALLGAAAGYAALALRFRKFSGAGAGSGAAEMKAAEAFSADWVRSAEAFSADWARSVGGTRARADGFRRAHEWARAQHASPGEQQQQRQASGEETFRRWSKHGLDGAAGSAAPAWALSELGLESRLGAAGPTRQELTRAYYAKARVLHPDTASTESDGEAFSRLNIAFVEAKRHT